MPINTDAINTILNSFARGEGIRQRREAKEFQERAYQASIARQQELDAQAAEERSRRARIDTANQSRYDAQLKLQQEKAAREGELFEQGKADREIRLSNAAAEQSREELDFGLETFESSGLFLPDFFPPGTKVDPEDPKRLNFPEGGTYEAGRERREELEDKEVDFERDAAHDISMEAFRQKNRIELLEARAELGPGEKLSTKEREKLGFQNRVESLAKDLLLDLNKDNAEGVKGFDEIFKGPGGIISNLRRKFPGASSEREESLRAKVQELNLVLKDFFGLGAVLSANEEALLHGVTVSDVFTDTPQSAKEKLRGILELVEDSRIQMGVGRSDSSSFSNPLITDEERDEIGQFLRNDKSGEEDETINSLINKFKN